MSIVLPISLNAVQGDPTMKINNVISCHHSHFKGKNDEIFKFIFLPFFYHLPVKSLFFTNLPVNLKAGKSSTLFKTN